MRQWIPCAVFVLLAGGGAPAGSQSDPPKKYHSVEVEVVSADVEAMTLTVKVDGEEKTLPVSRLAKTRLSEVKPGDKVMLSCKDVEGKDREIVSIRSRRNASPR